MPEMSRPVSWVLLLAAILASRPLAAQPARTIAVGQRVSDSLTDADPKLRSRHAPYHVWTLAGRAGQHVVLELTSPDFDAYLVLRDGFGATVGSDDDSGEGQNARLRAVLPRDGTYLVIATGFGESARGRYTLAVSGWEPPEAPAPGRGATIEVGETKDGVLEPRDEVSGDGPYQDRWTFDARAGARLRVEMRSADLDSYLTVLAPDGRVLGSDDDGLGGRDAAVSLRAATAGRYTALASSYGDAPATGAYRITLVEDRGDFPEPGTAAAIAMGETREGRLEQGDLLGQRGLEDRWTLSGRAGDGVRIDATSTAFDTYLVLLQDGVAVDSNDDGGEGQNASIIAVLPETGTYTAAVSAYGGGVAGGVYALQLTALAGPPPAPGRTGRIVAGQRAVGRLEPGDSVRADGGLLDVWAFEARAGDDLVAELRSTAFDTYLELYDPDGTLIAQDDDGLGDGTNSLVTAHLERAGRYRLVVRAFGEKEANGLYEIAVFRPATAGGPGKPAEIRAGDFLVGRLEPGDSTVGDGTYGDLFLFRPQASGEAIIDLRSSDFDAYLILQDAAGRTLLTDDDGGEGTNARITSRVNAGETYRIIANSYGGTRTTGSYRISVRLASGALRR
jgi:hypothetical protein